MDRVKRGRDVESEEWPCPSSGRARFLGLVVMSGVPGELVLEIEGGGPIAGRLTALSEVLELAPDLAGGSIDNGRPATLFSFKLSKPGREAGSMTAIVFADALAFPFSAMRPISRGPPALFDFPFAPWGTPVCSGP